MERTESLSENFFPMRPGTNTSSGQEIKLATNYFRFSFLNNGVTCFFKYAVDFLPEIPGDSKDLRRKIWKNAASTVRKFLNHTIFNNTTCFSQENYSDPIEVDVNFEETNYKVYVKWTNQVLNDSVEALSLYKKFFGQIVRKLHYIPLRRNYFDSKGAHKVDNLEVWPGFNSAINIFPNGILLNINVIHKVLRPETALDQISKLTSKKQNCNDVKSEIEEMFKGAVVLTRYNNDKTYIIDSVDFGLNPTCQFKFKDRDISFTEYYQEKYNKSITDKSQPLLVCKDKKTNTNIYLIPEFCFLTGLTDEMRANFNLMKNLANITKGTAGSKMNECVNLINAFLKKDKCLEDIKTWGITITPDPVKLEGRKLEAGNILMHKTGGNARFNFSIDTTDDIDRKIQTEMYSQPELNRWMLFYSNKDESIVQTMLETLKQVKGSFKYQMQEPKKVAVNSQYFKDWERAIETNLGDKNNNIGCQAVLLIIPGFKGKGNMYNDVKRLFTTKYAIPSQVVLSGTLGKRKLILN
jgi:aubergine-like protein